MNPARYLLKSGALAAASALIFTGPVLATPSSLEEADPELRCMADAIAYEAGTEPPEGQEAVAQVILNRVRDPLYPKSVCGVVYQGAKRSSACQFTFTCDGALSRRLPEKIRVTAEQTARRALDGTLAETVAGATHYHADYVSPVWARSLTRIVTIGRHIFYRRPGVADTPAAPAAPPANAGFNAWGIMIASAPR